MQPSWTWFWKQVTFYHGGKYKVYVSDANNRFLTSGTVMINFNQ
jgi:hypothetical protein